MSPAQDVRIHISFSAHQSSLTNSVTQDQIRSGKSKKVESRESGSRFTPSAVPRSRHKFLAAAISDGHPPRRLTIPWKNTNGFQVQKASNVGSSAAFELKPFSGISFWPSDLLTTSQNGSGMTQHQLLPGNRSNPMRIPCRSCDYENQNKQGTSNCNILLRCLGTSLIGQKKLRWNHVKSSQHCSSATICRS